MLALPASRQDALLCDADAGPRVIGPAHQAFLEMCRAAESLLRASAGPNDRLFNWLWRGTVEARVADW